MTHLYELRKLLVEEQTIRERTAISMFVAACRGEEIDGKKMINLQNEANQLKNALNCIKVE